jgi:LPS-assembly lipoprotein
MWSFKSFARALIWVVVPIVIAGCGFHLRGAVSYPFDTLFLNAPTAPAPFTAELRRAIEGSRTTKLVEGAAAAQVVLDITSVVDDKQVLSLSGGGRVREYSLAKRVLFSVHDANGVDWLPAAELVVRRTYSFNESEVLAREAQELRLLAEMQTDAVQQILRRLQAAKKPTG